MPLSKLNFQPGINKETTAYASEGTFFDGNWVRFRKGYPEKIGGWQNQSYNSTYKGVARSLLNWVSYTGDNMLALGTSQKYYVELGGTYRDITPLRTTVTLGADPFATVSGSKLVTVTASAHAASVGTFVTFSGATAVAGITLSGEYEIVSLIDGNSYKVISATAANATTTGGGGAVSAAYQINAGNSTYTLVTGGWGTGTWGSGGWGQSTGVGISLPMRHWSQINYGQDLVFAARGGEIYYWVLDTASTPARAVTLESRTNTLTKASTTATSGGAGTTITVTSTVDLDYGAVVTGTNVTAGTYITDINFTTKVVTLSATTTGAASGTYTFSYSGRAVPNKTEMIFAADGSKFTVALGANPYDPTNLDTTYDPMLVRWSAQDNVYEWVPAATNQSGEFKLTIGSYLITAQNTRQEILVWTDAALYSMQYLGPPYVFGFTLLSANISIASPNAVATANNTTYWMGVDKFYVYTGRVEPLPCSLLRHVYSDLNRDQLNQVTAGTNEGFNEVWWFYPSANSTTNDRYVIFNYAENIWYHGSLSRTAWLDSSLRASPMGGFSVQTTYLSSAITSAVTEIPVLDTSSYPTSGTVTIDNETITYTGKTAVSLIGCTRGTSATTAASHTAYTSVSYYISNQVMYHEQGVDDFSSQVAQAIDSYIDTSDFDIGDGHQFSYVWRMLPDLTFNGSTAATPRVQIAVLPRNNSGGPYLSPASPWVTRAATYPVEQFTGEVFTRMRGRQMRFRIQANEVGVMWQMGAMRIDVRPDGRKV